MINDILHETYCFEARDNQCSADIVRDKEMLRSVNEKNFDAMHDEI